MRLARKAARGFATLADDKPVAMTYSPEAGLVVAHEGTVRIGVMAGQALLKGVESAARLGARAAGNGLLGILGPKAQVAIQYAGPPGEFSTLVRNPDGSFTRTLRNGSILTYFPSGLIVNRLTIDGLSTSYEYNPSGTLARLIIPRGKHFHLVMISEAT